ncbi:MAG: PAS domain S-box protein [Magnetococcales bacterium]|nr:PAS domain S-box protein [Magnetococcales bacterium]
MKNKGFLAFSLIIVSVIASGWLMIHSLNKAEDDAELINSLGRQRMLSQGMAKSILGYALAKSSYQSIHVRIDTLNAYLTKMRKVYTETMLTAAEKNEITLSRHPKLDDYTSFPYPATFTRMVNEEYQSFTGLSVDIIAENPINPDKKLNTPLDWEANKFLKNNPGKTFTASIEKSGGLDLLFYTGDIATSEQCLLCHITLQDRELHLGDLLGVRKYVVNFSDNFLLGKQELEPSLEEYESLLSVFKKTLAAVKEGGAYPTDLKGNKNKTVAPISDHEVQKKILEIEHFLKGFVRSTEELISADVNSKKYRNSRRLILSLSNQMRNSSDDLVTIYTNIAQRNQQQIYGSVIIMGLIIILIVFITAFSLKNSALLEKKVQERTKELRKLVQSVEQSPICVVITDILGTIEYVNPTFTSVTGYNKDEILGENPRIFQSGKTSDASYEDVWNTIMSGGTWQGEVQSCRKNGELFWASISIAPVSDESGAITHFVSMIEDVTELKRSTEAIKEREERLNQALKGGDLGFWDVDVQSGNTVVNQRYADIFGFPLGVLEMDRSQWIKCVHPEDRDRVLERGEEYRFGKIADYEVEYRIVSSQGEIIWVVSKGTAVTRGDDGVALRMVGTVQDITQRRIMEAALTESLERSRLILESVGDGIFGLDIEGNTTFVNGAAAAMLGYSEKELTGVSMHHKVHHSHPDGTPYPSDECHMRAAFMDGKTRQINDEILWRKDGTNFQIEYSAVPILKDGTLLGAVVIFRDITSRLQAEHDLRDKLDELEKFNSVAVGRELRMIALKKEVNALKIQQGEKASYEIAED